MELGANDYVINEIAAKAATYDYIMSHVMDKDFESTAAVANDVLKRIFEVGKESKDETTT